MKKFLFLVLLFSFHTIFGQDKAGNKTFTKFLNNNVGSNIRSIVDENGMETILAVVTGTIALNGNLIVVPSSQLMIFRHFIGDSMGFTYTYISQPLGGAFSFAGFSDLCLTSKGVGFCINFASRAITLKYPVFGTNPPNPYNSVYLELDSQFNLVSSTKFSSTSNFNLMKITADKAGNKYAFLSYFTIVYLDDVVPIYGNGSNSNSMISFRDKTLNWIYGFETLGGLASLQLLESDYSLYFSYYATSKDIKYRGNNLKINAQTSIGLLKIDTSGALLHEFITDTISGAIYNYAFLLAKGNRVFASFPYSQYIKIGNIKYSKTTNHYVSLFLELDTAFNIINWMNFSNLSTYTITNPKAYDPVNELLYLDMYHNSSTSSVKATVINDTFFYFNNFRHFFNNQEAHNLFAYNTKSKSLVAVYDYSPVTNYLSNVYIPGAANPIVYADVILGGNIKLEGQSLNDNNLRVFNFTLSKPKQMVKPPSRVNINRKPGYIADISWRNNDIYDSLQLEKYEIQTNQFKGAFSTTGNVSTYADITFYYVKYNYYFKVRGFRGGEPSIWSASDSSATADTLKIERFIYAGSFNDSDIAIFWGNDGTPANNIYFTTLYRSDNRYSGFTALTTVPKTVKSFLDTNVIRGKSYYYFAMDHNSMFQSSSDTIQVKLGGTIIIGANNYKVYPNPFSSILNFELEDTTRTSFIIIDALGRSFEIKLQERNGIFYADFSKLSEGMYIIRHEQEGKFITTRVIKI